jgi:hypothetical protein
MQNGFVALLTTNFTATAVVLAARFIGADGQHADAGANAIGVARSDGEIGDVVPLDVLGTTLVEAGNVVGDWDLVQVGADGKAVPKTDGIAVGRVQGAGGTAGTLLEVLLIPN